MPVYQISGFKPTNKTLVDTKAFTVDSAEYDAVEYSVFTGGVDTPVSRAQYAMKLARDGGILFFVNNILETAATNGQLVRDTNFVGCCCNPCLPCNQGQGPAPSLCTEFDGFSVTYGLRQDLETFLTDAGFTNSTTATPGESFLYLPYRIMMGGAGGDFTQETGFVSFTNSKINNMPGWFGLALGGTPFVGANAINSAGYLEELARMLLLLIDNVQYDKLSYTPPNATAPDIIGGKRRLLTFGTDYNTPTMLIDAPSGVPNQPTYEYLQAQLNIQTVDDEISGHYPSDNQWVSTELEQRNLLHEWQLFVNVAPEGVNILDLFVTPTGTSARTHFEQNGTFRTCRLVQVVNTGD